MRVTIGVKALNEERHIAAALESAVRAVEPFGGEVLLADSGSTDRTIEIARRFPVRIVQLARPAERSCGASAQLAFQSASGSYFYMLDGDMVLHAGFLAAGIAFLDANPDVAAVGGHVREQNTRAESFEIQAAVAGRDSDRQPGFVDRLDGGGLYRSDAVREAGYFADRNLHAFEEFDLAARLRSRGWKLARIDCTAADHYGHDMGGYRLLVRRLRTGYAGGAGEVLRGAIGERHLRFVLSKLKHVYYGIGVIGWWLLLLACAWWSPTAAAAGFVLPLLFLCARRRSIRLGLYSLASWNVNAAGVIAGFLRRRVSPHIPLASVTFSDRQHHALRSATHGADG